MLYNCSAVAVATAAVATAALLFYERQIKKLLPLPNWTHTLCTSFCTLPRHLSPRRAVRDFMSFICCCRCCC